MRVTPSIVSSATLLVLTALGIHSAQGALVGLWEFENAGSLTSATIGSNLALTGADAAVAGSGTPSDTGASRLGIGDYYTATHGIAANGGGSFVNEYTILWDVMYPAATAGNWKTFLQTTPTNANDRELFVNPNGTIGVAATGYSANATTADTWYRVVASVDNGSFYRLYVNGNEWLNGTIQTVDGRFSLDPVFHAMADNDGDDALMNLSNLAIWDSALDANAIVALGGAGRALAVPEPASMMLAFLALAGVLGGRRR
jgi:hypothetical protein